MKLKKGMAGLILLVLVIGYMMAISTSSTMMIQTESAGKFARRGYKNAHYAAIAGIGMVMAHLRSQPLTFDPDPDNRPYFTRINPDGQAHYCGWTASTQTYGGSNHTAPGWISCSTTFPNNVEVDPSRYLTKLCTYPGVDPDTGNAVYYVKSQGKYLDPLDENEFYAQAWAQFSINVDARIPRLIKFGTMSVQTATYTTVPASVNDFWDWQNDFQ